MKRLIVLVASAGLALGLAPLATAGATGSGAPSGSHYDLNLIGVAKNKSASMTGSDTHAIFVPLAGNCKINLTEGDFQVLDGNCTDGSSGFQLPNPDPTNSGTTSYTVFARALGKPGGSSHMNTCFTDSTGTQYCSTGYTFSSSGGKSTFQNVSQDLLYVYYCVDGKVQRVPLF